MSCQCSLVVSGCPLLRGDTASLQSTVQICKKKRFIPLVLRFLLTFPALLLVFVPHLQHHWIPDHSSTVTPVPIEFARSLPCGGMRTRAFAGPLLRHTTQNPVMIAFFWCSFSGLLLGVSPSFSVIVLGCSPNFGPGEAFEIRKMNPSKIWHLMWSVSFGRPPRRHENTSEEGQKKDGNIQKKAKTSGTPAEEGSDRPKISPFFPLEIFSLSCGAQCKPWPETTDATAFIWRPSPGPALPRSGGELTKMSGGGPNAS